MAAKAHEFCRDAHRPEPSSPATNLSQLTGNEAALGADFERSWRKCAPRWLGSPHTAFAAEDGAAQDHELRRLPRRQPTNTAVEITFHRDPSVYDGRFANNGWLQELPQADDQDDLGQSPC